MSLSDLASIGSLVSGLAVLASLVLLFFQLRQLNRQVLQAERNQQASIRHSRVTRNVDMLLARLDPGLVDAWQHGMRNPDKITEMELTQFVQLCRATTLNWEDAFYMHEEGLLNEDAYETVLAAASALLRLPGIRVAWKEQVRRGYAGRFRDFMDDLIARARLEPPTVNPSVDEWRAAYAAETASASH
jgi:hypothetical protein